MRDVIIIGAGPVGLHAARRLAADGYDVEVLEEHPSAGEPVHCTGILAPEIFEEFSLPLSSAVQELRCVRFHSPGGRVVEYLTERPEAVVVDRRSFDRDIRDLAQAAGAAFSMGVRATKIEIQKDRTTVRCAGEESRDAKACILATGSSYALHRDLGIGFPPVFLNCAQAEFSAPGVRDVEIHVGRKVAPSGFAWVVPVRRPEGMCARIGLMCDGNAGVHFERFLAGLGRLGIPAEARTRPRQSMLPLAPIRKTFGDRLLVAGDAAGFVKPTTGGGVYYGMISAEIAAQVLGDALRDGALEESVLSRYQRLWQSRLMEEIEAQLTLRLLLQRLNDEEMEEIFDLWATDGLMPLIRKTVHFNRHRKLIAALIRYPAMRRILFR